MLDVTRRTGSRIPPRGARPISRPKSTNTGRAPRQIHYNWSALTPSLAVRYGIISHHVKNSPVRPPNKVLNMNLNLPTRHKNVKIKRILLWLLFINFPLTDFTRLYFVSKSIMHSHTYICLCTHNNGNPTKGKVFLLSSRPRNSVKRAQNEVVWGE